MAVYNRTSHIAHRTSHIAHRTSHIAHRTSPNSLSSSGRIQEIDTLRGFAIFLVVLGHAIIHFPIDLHENLYCESVFQWLSSVHMPLFFVIAGFCWSCRDYGTYIRKKFLRLVVPYVVFGLIDMLPRQILASFVNRPRPMSESVIRFLLYGGEFWFIYTLFMIFLIYPLIFRLVNSSRRNMILLAILFGVLSVHGIHISLLNISSVGYYLFFFHAGVMLKTFSGGKWPDMKFSSFLLPFMFALWLVLLFNFNDIRVVTALIGIITCGLMTKYEIFNRMFSRFGEYSLQIYLLNGITLGISRAIICNILHVYRPVAIITFNMLIDFFASYIFIKYVCKKSKILSYMMGIV